MMHCQDEDYIVLHQMDHPITSYDHFAKLLPVEFGHHTAHHRKGCEFLAGSKDALDEQGSSSRLWGIYVVGDCFNVVEGARRPDY